MIFIIPMGLFVFGIIVLGGQRDQALGMKNLAHGNLMEAHANFTKVIRLNPEYGPAHLSMAFIHSIMGEPHLMESSIERAVRLDKSIDCLKKSAHMYYTNGQWDRAFPLYKTLAETYPEHLTPRIQLAEIELKRGQPAKAKPYAWDVLHIEPRVKSDTYPRNKARAREILELLP